MMTPHDLHTFVRDSARTRVLTVYLNARVSDPARRHAWRAALTTAVRAARAAVVDEGERADFDRAAGHLERLTSATGGGWSAPGWVAFLAPDGPLHVADLPVQVPTLAVWREGPVVVPYVPVLEQHRPVIVTVVDSRSARFFRYAWGALTPLRQMTLTVPEQLGPAVPPPSELRATSSPAPRGALATEHASRRRGALFRRLSALLGARVAEPAGTDGWILVGGTPEWARLAGEALASRFAERLVISGALDHDAADHEIEHAAQAAATALRAAHGRALLDRLLERALPQGRAELGHPAAQRALHAHAVDLLLLSPEFVRLHTDDAEQAVRVALDHGATVEVLSGEAAAILDRVGHGIAARLRFAVADATSRVA